MFVSVESVELLELVINLLWHLELDIEVDWPICSLETLDLEVKVRLVRIIVCLGSYKRVKLFRLFLNCRVVLKHSLHLVHLLHATRDLKTCNELLLELEVLVGLLKQSPSQLVLVNHKEQILIFEEAEECREVLHKLFKSLSIAFDISLAHDLVDEGGEQLGHGELAHVQIEEVLEGDLKLTIEHGVCRKAVRNDLSEVL